MLEVYIAICKERKLDGSVSKALCKPILTVVGKVLTTTHHFITHGVPTSWGGDEQIAGLREVFATLPAPIDHKQLFLANCHKICKYAKKEREEIRKEKEKERNLKRQQSKEEKEESDKKKVAAMLKPQGEHVGKALQKKLEVVKPRGVDHVMKTAVK